MRLDSPLPHPLTRRAMARVMLNKARAAVDSWDAKPAETDSEWSSYNVAIAMYEAARAECRACPLGV